MSSIEREVESALINAVSATNIPYFYTSEREGARLLPNLTAQAKIANELLVPFSGVFGLSATLTYTSRADSVSRAGFDHEFQTIVQELYREPNLASYMTSNSSLKVFKASIGSETGSIVANNRTWQKDIVLNIQATMNLIPTNGLSLWLKADAGVTLSGSNVTAWADQSGNGKNMTSESGFEPIFIASELNSKPVIDFNLNKYLTTSFTETNISQQSVFIVFKFVSTNLTAYARPFSQSNIDEKDYTTPNNILPLLRRDGTNDMWCYSSVNEWLASIPVLDNAWYISTTISNGTNGSFSLNANNTQTYAATLNANITNMRVGGSIFVDGLPADQFNSKLAEVIIYNRTITNTERQQVESYLNTKYAIY